MAALIEYVCTAQHDRREEPAVTWQQGSWAYCSWGAEDRHQWTRIDPTAIETLRPTAIIGVSTVGKAFTQPVIEAMARINERPIIFPYSNPTSHSECTAEEAYVWSEGRAVFASGSPFAPVQYKGHTFVPGQGNNVYIFPALGMAIYATEAKRVTDEMIITAAHALAAQVTPSDLETGLIYPPQSSIFETSLAVAREVAEFIFDQGLAGVPRPDDLDAYMEAKVYRPAY